MPSSRIPRGRIVLVILLIISILLLTLYVREGEEGILHDTQRIAIEIFAPIQKGVFVITSPFKKAYLYIANFGTVYGQNKELKKEVKELRQAILSLKTFEEENKRLRELLAFKKKNEFETISAQVIGKSATNWRYTIIIDRGSKDGIKKNMPVIVADGLVGQVTEVSGYASQVKLIIDPKSGVGAQLLESRETGIVEGEVGGNLSLSFITREANINKGDAVVTSGLGGLYPKGIYIGLVEEVDQKSYSLYKEIIVSSPIDFSKLEEVMIIINPPPELPFETDRDGG